MHVNSSLLPTVAIVGKPNVGKSSLFNRLIKHRKAIVSEEPGVTRDINYEVLGYRELRYRLADSAGYFRDRDNIHTITQKLNRRLINEASVIVFVCDIQSLSSEDYEIADIIRKSGKPFILAVNKVDNQELLNSYYDFFDLGIDEPVPISAMHGKNISDLLQRIAEYLEATCEHPYSDVDSNSEDKILPVAIVGKPNVGKSSLLNLLIGKSRSIVTEDPGTTRDAVDEIMQYEDHIMKFIDTAGIRKKGKIRENVEFYSIVRAERAIKNAVLSILVIDSLEGITKQDKKIASTIVREKKGLIIAANKWDIARELEKTEEEFIRDIYRDFPHISFADIIPISAKIGYNKIKLLKKIINVYNNYYSNIKTGELNNFVNSLSMHREHIKYGFQRGTAPPRFEFFVRKADIHDNNFKKFIVNSIRKRYHLTGVPIEVRLRTK